MTRVKRGVIANKRRKNVLKDAKGYRFGRSTKERLAKVATTKAGMYAFTHRRDKKNDFRRLWTVRLNAGLRALGTKYSTFIDVLNKANIKINRKMLSQMAAKNPETFERIVKQVTN
ncbi:50S ribosomal protein L20 [Candidatus Wolfebacteria bacterium]|nr:MAG: 50S ribosomal protein L20 [Candidatus Wolfebacteria bacterium]